MNQLQASNRLYKANVVGTAALAPNPGLDELYTYDLINRLNDMQRGTLNSAKTAVTGTIAAEQQWTLDPTGNWAQFATLANGAATMTQTRTANTVNEITAIVSIAPPPPPTGIPTPPAWVTPLYDPAGNMITMPQVIDPTQSFTATYDAWNRMTVVDSGGTSVGAYQYDGRNFRIIATTSTETRHFFFTSQWQDIEERVGTSTTMDKQYVNGIRYIDEYICRDDATPLRLYTMQDANFNLTGICDTSGNVKERYFFDPYGLRTIMNAAWGVIGASGYGWVVGHQGLIAAAESLITYNRNRYLQPLLGVFTTQDPLEYLDSVNRYEYLMSAPPQSVDPSGTAMPGAYGPHPTFKPKAPASSGGQFIDVGAATCEGKEERIHGVGSSHKASRWTCLITCVCDQGDIKHGGYAGPSRRFGRCPPNINMGWRCFVFQPFERSCPKKDFEPQMPKVTIPRLSPAASAAAATGTGIGVIVLIVIFSPAGF